MSKREFAAFSGLIIATIIWGFSFALQKEAAEYLPPLYLNSIRFTVGGIVVLAVSKVIDKYYTGGGIEGSYTSGLFKAGVYAGFFLAASMGLQQFALSTSNALNAGFITNLDVIIFPLLLVIVHKKSIAKEIWIAAVTAVVGLYLLSFSEGSFAVGDILLFGTAVFIALRTLAVSKYANSFNPVKLASVMFLTVGFLSGIVGLLFEDAPSTAQLSSALVPILYLTFLSTAVAFTVEALSFTIIDPIKVSFIINFEVLFSILGALVITGETFTGKTFVGSLILLAAIAYAVSTKSKRPAKPLKPV